MVKKMPALCSPGVLFPVGLQGLVFDVDGVLFDSRSSNTEYYNLVLSSLGLPPMDRAAEDFCHMASVNEALERIVPSHRREEAERVCAEINYQERILPMLVPEPGLLEALHWLKQWDVRMAVCTNRTNSVDGLLRYFGLESFFAPVKTAAGGRPKPYPDGLLDIMVEWDVQPCQIAFLGDSKVDQQAAEAGQVPFWAFRNNDLSAQMHFSDFFELITWITPLVERH